MKAVSGFQVIASTSEEVQIYFYSSLLAQVQANYPLMYFSGGRSSVPTRLKEVSNYVTWFT